jgi:hypothetical protein
VLGDEAIDAIGQQVLPWLDEPNSEVIRALHPAGFDEDRPTTLPIVLFHDAVPLAEEAARRTRVPAVFVVTGFAAGPRRPTPSAAIVRPSRRVLLFAPGMEATPASWLTVYVRDSEILHWELDRAPETRIGS